MAQHNTTKTLTAVEMLRTAYPALNLDGAKALVEVASELKFDPAWLANIINWESGMTWNPAIQSQDVGVGEDGPSVGLIQLTPSRAAGLGFTTNRLAEMTQAEQLRGPIYKWLNTKFNQMSYPENYWDVYLAVYDWQSIGQGLDDPFLNEYVPHETVRVYVDRVNSEAKLAVAGILETVKKKTGMGWGWLALGAAAAVVIGIAATRD